MDKSEVKRISDIVRRLPKIAFLPGQLSKVFDKIPVPTGTGIIKVNKVTVERVIGFQVFIIKLVLLFSIEVGTVP